MELWTYLPLAIGYLATLMLIRWVLLTRKRQPIASVAWILAIILLPLLGGVLFLFFGINQVERRKALKLAATRVAADSVSNLTDYEEDAGGDSTLSSQLHRLAELSCGYHVTRGNSIELLIDTNIAFRRIEEAILAAQKSIHLEYYLWKPDKAGRRIRDLLIERARQGIEVRFLYDGIGSILLRRSFLRSMSDAGIHVASFLPGQSLRERWSLNLRCHRKIVVVDGRLGFTGGMNIGDEYLGRNKQIGYWRDTHLRMTGPSVLQLQQVFAEDWYYATGEDLTTEPMFPDPSTDGDVTAQVVSGGPVDEIQTFHALMFSAINEARERITLATSFFVPTDGLSMALETAALRGVDVRLLLSGRSMYPWTLMAARSYYEALLRSGVKIHEYRRGVLHSKTLTIDGCWSLVGSPNFDPRSLVLNFEVGVAMSDERIALELERHFTDDLEHAREIRLDQWIRRPLRSVLIENFCRLFSPVM
ncbi:MAG: cardiolipin synthase [Planctomycetaceae bacterium]